MATVDIRKRKDGTYRFRVRIRIPNVKYFSITFSDLDAAWDWVDKYEQAFREDPAFFFVWRRDNYKYMCRRGLREENHLVRPIRKP